MSTLVGDDCMDHPPGKILEDVIIKCDESNGWMSAASACYKYYSNDYAWSDANNYCLALGGALISVESQEEQDLVTLQGSTYKTDIWIGASDITSGTSGVYQWPDGVNIGPYTNWAPGQPDNRLVGETGWFSKLLMTETKSCSYSSMGGNCAEVVSTASEGQWNTAACPSGRKFICEKPEGVCPTGWRIFRGNCYQVNTMNKYTWTDSKHYCETQGAVENNYVVSLFEELQNVGITDIWIGMSDVATDGIFAWSDGSSVSYTNWNTNQPSDIAGSPDCGTIFTVFLHVCESNHH
ncbi:C-type mannose receptor 2-like [Amphiura filiformis]|uniref:C-type mannose receptor 2-like n=1 Tax=Amphiura filiformis TaxID=82378 RepID=UPI003B224469